MRGLLRAALLALCGLAGPVFGQSQSISLAEAIALARTALSQGEPQLALNIGKGLLQANPKDPNGLLIVAAAQSQLNNPINGRRAAARAYRNTKDRRQKLDAAQIAAGLALRADRPTLTQIWLRRASLHATHPQTKQQIEKDYRRVRDMNPWNFNLSLSVRPSSNVNNGADTDLQIVDGLNAISVGRLSAAAQALSGVIAQGQLNVNYRLQASAKSKTELRTRVRVQRVDLSKDARALADDARQDAIDQGQPIEDIPDDPRNRDFGSTYADVTLRHSLQLGESAGDVLQLGFGLGASWYGGKQTARIARLDASRRWRLNGRTNATLFGSFSSRDVVGSTASDSETFALRGSLRHKLTNGAALSLSLGVADTKSDQPRADNTAWSLRTRYSFAQAWGPAKVSAGVSLQTADYSVYPINQFVSAPGGRQDQSAYADLTLFFAEYDYAGFAPELTIRAGKRSSNISRFDTRELSVSVGIQSKF